MAPPVDIDIRAATIADAATIAAVHAESWRHNYRGAYSDGFLDGDVLADREATWSKRLSDEANALPPATTTFIAHRPGAPEIPVSFAHLAFDVDPRWGSLLDNLHVSHDLKRSGIGRRLIEQVARAALVHSRGRGANSALHLYVLEQNTAAQAFYQALGGRFVEASFVSAPGGIASRLNNKPKRHLYVWDDVSALLPSS